MIVAGLLDPLVNLLITFVQAILDGLAGLVNAVIDAWPIGMPDLPTLPSGLVTVVQWVKWSPIPVDAFLAFFSFCVTVWIAWLLVRPLLRFFKVDT